jgi:DMSO/TMAO reductase YedYZ molybdopterin-dependent catalytic subunit
MVNFNPGFRGRRERDPRLPPGQYDAGHTWPVLTAEATPKLDTDKWTFAVEGLVAHRTTWTWEQIHALPESTYNGHIHCVTTWSKLGMVFSGTLSTAFSTSHSPSQPPATWWPGPTAAGPPTCPWPTSPAAKPGSPGK